MRYRDMPGVIPRQDTSDIGQLVYNTYMQKDWMRYVWILVGLGVLAIIAILLFDEHSKFKREPKHISLRTARLPRRRSGAQSSRCRTSAEKVQRTRVIYRERLRTIH